MLFDLFFFFFKQKTAYEMRISDWSSDVCSSDLRGDEAVFVAQGDRRAVRSVAQVLAGGAVVERHRRHAAGHRLERDVAERLRQAREQEQVGAGEVARQRFAALHAAEDEVRVLDRKSTRLNSSH